MTYKIERNHEHFVVYIDGKFFCTADSRKEAKTEVMNYAEESGMLDEIESA